MLITENQLDEWVRSHSRDAQGIIVELVWRLVAASSPGPKERRFPLGDSLGQHGPDGVLDVDHAYEPYIPLGYSYWEIGTGNNGAQKATSDYAGLVKAIPRQIRVQSIFIFVTPLSGRRDWPFSWKDDAQADWLAVRQSRGDWKDVRVIDGTKLIDWLSAFPAIALWLLQRMISHYELKLDLPEKRWKLLRSIGDPPLQPRVFLVGRDNACTRLKEVCAGTVSRLKLQTHYPEQVTDFVAACLEDFDYQNRIEISGRCLVIDNVVAWEMAIQQDRPHILIADVGLDLNDDQGAILLQKACCGGHAVIHWAPPGGLPDPRATPLPTARVHQMREALECCGYPEERARILSEKCGGHLGTLLRCLQNHTLIPKWTAGTVGTDLLYAMFMGAWDEHAEADRTVIESFVGRPYDDWIGQLRDLAMQVGTPLTQHDGCWKFMLRYEGWFALGPRLYGDFLSRFQTVAIRVLKASDPLLDAKCHAWSFDRAPDKRLTCSSTLRKGVAETLALLGNHPVALNACAFGRAEMTAVAAVRDLLVAADWQRWANLDAVLPLLAEAAPRIFLDAVESALVATPCPFDTVFALESPGGMGHNYLTGLLWALETLSWSPDEFGRVVQCLGSLASRDPGGNWSNRPANSLGTILLPWLPQTCAPIEMRTAAVKTLLNEYPVAGWSVLLGLMPNARALSHGTRRPVWRQLIPEDWPQTVTSDQYSDQIERYARMLLQAAQGVPERLRQIIERLDQLPAHTRIELLKYLESDKITTLPEAERLPLWSAVLAKVVQQRRLPPVDWVLESTDLDRMSALAVSLMPELPSNKYRPLFSERDFELFETLDDIGQQVQRLEERRRQAIVEIAAVDGVAAVLTFAEQVRSPWRVGVAYGAVSDEHADAAVLPHQFDAGNSALSQFAAGFVWGRFTSRGWSWVDLVVTGAWKISHIGRLFTCLPFVPETWGRVARLLDEDESYYWLNVQVNPYDALQGLDHGIDKLIRYGRPKAALHCLYRQQYGGVQIKSEVVVRALHDALSTSEKISPLDDHETVELIRALQQDPNIKYEDLLEIEWAYLGHLNTAREAVPRALWKRLATDPVFFCEMIRSLDPPTDEESCAEEPSAERRKITAQAYRLLRDWALPPGVQADGSYDGDALCAWLNHVKEDCGHSGHSEAAMALLGQALFFAPPDPGGLWIHRDVATVLNGADAREMRSGFHVQAFNSRGVHSFTSGKAERELAIRYRERADAVEIEGFHRLATTLRDLASGYDQEAERDAKWSPQGL